MPKWSAIDGWRAPASHVGWAAADAWSISFRKVGEVSAAALAQLVERWDERLKDVGGDPSHEDWAAFRPLRLSREEDWSDWLGHLIEHSRSGRFVERLFTSDVREPGAWMAERAEREVCAEGYRADLVVRFRAGDWAHVEVKVGDLSLSKTAATGAALMRRIGGRCRGEFLLLPEADVPHWDADAGVAPEERARIGVITWEQLARALRVSLVEPDAESMS